MDINTLDRIYKRAVLIRSTESRLLELFSQGRLFGTVHTSIGQELSASIAAEFLSDNDYVFSNHRCHGHFIALTDRVEDLIAEIMGKETGVCGGWGGSQHLCSGRFFSNGIQGGFVPITAGLAISQKLKGTRDIACCFIGEGTLGEGAVYETANLMSKWKLPMLIVIENNRFSQSTPQEKTIAGEILDRFRALDISCYDADTWEPGKLYEVFGEAVSYIRGGNGPAVLRIQTDRLMAHSKGDDNRPKELIEQYYSRDVLTKLKTGEADKYAAWEAEAKERIDRAVEAAEAAKLPVTPVFEPDCVRELNWHRSGYEDKRRINEIIRDCFSLNMEKDDRIVMLGEDICDPYGGAFKVTKGLSDKFPDRVFGTTISEYSIAGIGNGLSLAGKLPVCEIMFGDFMTFTLDQILNHASKFPYMYDHQVINPIIIRTPMGGGRGYGPTHSQSLEKHFLGIPQTLAISLNARVNPADIYDTLFKTLKQPAIVFENKKMYSGRLKGDAAEGFNAELSDEEFPTVRIRPDADAELTLLCYGGMLEAAEEAQIRIFDELDMVAEVICPTKLYPFDISALLQSVAVSRRLIVIEEGHAFAGWGGEIISRITETAPGLIKYVRRINMPDCPIPCSGVLEKELLPGVEDIIDAAGCVGEDIL